jgi:hypothetical protein
MTLDSEGYVDATDFLSVTHTNIEIDCYFIRPFRALEGEELEFAGGVKETTGLNRRSFDIETAFLPQDEHSFIDEVVTEIDPRPPPLVLNDATVPARPSDRFKIKFIRPLVDLLAIVLFTPIETPVLELLAPDTSFTVVPTNKFPLESMRARSVPCISKFRLPTFLASKIIALLSPSIWRMSASAPLNSAIVPIAPVSTESL